jgi:hypothetical protein
MCLCGLKSVTSLVIEVRMLQFPSVTSSETTVDYYEHQTTLFSRDCAFKLPLQWFTRIATHESRLMSG